MIDYDERDNHADSVVTELMEARDDTTREKIEKGIPAVFHTIIFKLPTVSGWIIDKGDAFIWGEKGEHGKYYLTALKAGDNTQYICTGVESTPIGYAVPCGTD